MQNKINETIVDTMVNDIKQEVKRFKRDGYSVEETRNFINKCYIISRLKNLDSHLR